MERLAALEAEVKADADAQQARKAAAIGKLREQRAQQASERDRLRARQAELVGKTRASASPSQASRSSEPSEPDRDPPARFRRPSGRPGDRASARLLGGTGDAEVDPLENLGGALELASKAHRVKQELSRAPRKGDKSWIKSGVASLALGPVGWLYAGSLREAVPATAAWLALAVAASKFLPVFLMMPVLMVVLPLSAIAGVVYALQYNRSGGRQRLFERDGSKDKPKQLRSGDRDP
jgi:hypothetical protein